MPSTSWCGHIQACLASRSAPMRCARPPPPTRSIMAPTSPRCRTGSATPTSPPPASTITASRGLRTARRSRWRIDMSKRTSAAGITARGTRGKKKEERARSPQLTGGEGFTYEDVIAAYFLAALLREEAALAQPGLVTRVAVQQDRQGEPMDDVIVDSDAAGTRNRLSLQVKRSVTVSASNADFQNSSPKRSRPALS